LMALGRTQGPEIYGILLAAISAGAIGGSFALGWLKVKLGVDRVLAFGSLGTTMTLVLFGLVRDPMLAVGVSLVAGASWIVVMANLYVSAQDALPDWVCARGLAIFLAVIFGAMSVGSASWGQIAETAGLPMAYFMAAAGIIIAIPLAWRWKLQIGVGTDLSPSMHWPVPKLAQNVENDRGPVLVTVEYHVVLGEHAAFLKALEELRHERKRDGGFAWGAFEDASDSGRFLETFRVESWLELLHLRERVTNADRILEDKIRQSIAEPPRVTLLIAPEGRHRWRRALKHHGEA
jgi:MFS family permease